MCQCFRDLNANIIPRSLQYSNVNAWGDIAVYAITGHPEDKVFLGVPRWSPTYVIWMHVGSLTPLWMSSFWSVWRGLVRSLFPPSS